MKARSISALLSFLAVAVPAIATPELLLETNLYVFKNSEVRDTHVPEDATLSPAGSRFVSSPATLTFDRDELELRGETFRWNGGTAAPKFLGSIASPSLRFPLFQMASLLSTESVQYLERRPDGSYLAREIAADSTDAPHCRLTFKGGPLSADARSLTLSCELDISTVGAREPVPGLSLPAGKPVLVSFAEKLTVPVKVENWSALLVHAPNQSDYSLLVLLKATIAKPPVPHLTRTGVYQLRTPRFGAAAVADGDFVYVIGGKNAGGLLSDIERFNVTTHEITVLTNQLIPRHHQGAALVDGRIYIFGGQGDPMPQSSGFETAVEIYDLATGRISRGAPLPVPRAYFASAALNGKIYAIGGAFGDFSSVRQTNRTDVYDPALNRWTAGLPMPTVRETRAAVVAKGGILVAGGYRAPKVSSGSKAVELYLAAKNQWFSLPDLGEPVSANAAAVLGNFVFLFGNFDPADEVLAYDYHSHETTRLKTGMTPASQAVAVTVGDAICLIGGTGGGGQQRTDREASGDIQVFRLSAPTAQ